MCTCKEAYRIEKITNFTYPAYWEEYLSDDYEDFYSALVTSNISESDSLWSQSSDSVKTRIIILFIILLLSIPLNILIIIISVHGRNQRPTSSWLLFNVCIGKLR